MKRPLLMLALCLAGLAGATAASGAGLSPATYVTKVKGATPEALNATWRLRLERKGRFTLTRNNKIAAKGLYSIVGRNLNLHDLAGPYRCTGSQAVGSYTWRLRGSSLTLKTVRDNCSDRRAVLTHGLTKLPSR